MVLCEVLSELPCSWRHDLDEYCEEQKVLPFFVACSGLDSALQPVHAIAHVLNLLMPQLAAAEICPFEQGLLVSSFQSHGFKLPDILAGNMKGLLNSRTKDFITQDDKDVSLHSALLTFFAFRAQVHQAKMARRSAMQLTILLERLERRFNTLWNFFNLSNALAFWKTSTAFWPTARLIKFCDV